MALANGENIVDTITSTSILALYLFMNGRRVEGQYHTNAAVALVFSSQLHQMSPQVPIERVTGMTLFWQVFYLDRCWSSVIGRSPGFEEGDNPQKFITTPFPGDNRSNRSGSLVRQLIENPSLFPSNNIESLMIKSAIVFEQSAQFSNATSGSTNPPEWNRYFKLQAAVEHLLPTVPPLGNMSNTDLRIPVIYTLLHTATIYIYHPFVANDRNLQLLSLDAARSILGVIRAIRSSRYQFLDPILTFCWKVTAEVFIREKILAVGSSVPDQEVIVQGLQDELHVVVTALRKLSLIFPIADAILRQIEGQIESSAS
ncbi:hypothetical protein SISNIDRAFT_459439 [Sistotremastrum niveocremeum HHB9708]|uniref:Xylanolytic transcriptional activator regulatory domain-containing protein n=1 Tax=Sistotremastrum niveocremeum HHB9708 TaxID=1314777 RepID=A0A164PKC7_9AGAM|nr:hypothetical protein SISNIDRAFT_459439 [Sistotremastrum niveocremeum HHB9708]